MSIAAATLDAVRTEMERHPGSRATRAGILIGELSGVETESLRFCLETLVAGSDLDPLAFELEIRPWMRRCRQCGAEYRVTDPGDVCACGSASADTCGGAEMEFSYLELEEPECGSHSNEKS
jgi:hydrogenase nickel incorporation protein HypA/HybF